MGRWLQRLLMALVGLSVFLVYAAGAVLAYFLLQLWVGTLDPAVLVVTLGLAGVLLGYLSYRLGTARLLAAVRAAPVTRAQVPTLHRRLDELVERMDVARPELRIAQLSAPNALSLGSAWSGVVILDAGLLRLLTVDELEAIMAHELAHLESNDVLVRTVAVTVLQTVVGLLFLIVLPAVLLVSGVRRALAWIVGRPFRTASNPLGRIDSVVATSALGLLFGLTLSVRAYSRRREFAADERAARVTADPHTLASALRKIERVTEGPSGIFSHLYITGDDPAEDTIRKLLSTHPSMDERVAKLEVLAEEMEAARWTRIEVQ